MGLFNFDRPVKMKKADDQFGIGAVNPSTFLASKTKEKKDEKEKGLNLGIMNMLRREGGKASEFEKIKNEAFGNRSSNITESDTKVAGLSRKEIQQEKRELKTILNSGMPLTEKQRNDIINKITGVTPITDARGNEVYSDSIQTLGATEGSLLTMANTENRGIVTAAPETKITVPRLAGEGFFSPKNFQKSGSPDATIMTREQMGQALTGDPGYTRFGQLDRPGTQAAKDTAAFNERVRSQFFSPIKADPRSIAERKEANLQSIRDEARERDKQFRATGQQTFGGKVGERVSGDDTYGTNVMSNPAFGFRSKMSAENQKRYDASAAEATRRSEVEPSKGNLIQSTLNIGKRIFNTAIGSEGGTRFTKEVPLQTRGEAEKVRYEKYLNRPTYQKEATARKEAGITNQMTIDKNKAQVAADAEARNKEFQANKRAAAVERAAKRTPGNTGTGRSGTFGAGTTGKGMPSNPPGMRQTGVGQSANNLSRHSTGSSADQPSSTATGDTSFSSYVRGGGAGQQRGGGTTGSAASKTSSVSTTTKQGKPRTAAQMSAAKRKAAGPNRKMSAGQQTRAQAGTSARTAQGNRARVKANARKRAQAAAKKRRAAKKGKK